MSAPQRHATHLSARLALVPLRDLADCPNMPHHAVGSPLFDDRGRPLTPDPVLALTRAPLTSPALPRMSLAVAPCGARPPLTLGAEVRALLGAMRLEDHPQARREVEGLLMAGEARRSPPGALAGHLDGVLLLGVEGAWAGSEAWRGAQEALVGVIRELPQGAALRLPLFEALDHLEGGRAARAEVSAMLLDGHLLRLAMAALERPLDHSGLWTPRRLLICEPSEARASWALARLTSRALLLSLVDKLGLLVVSPLMTLGVVAGEGEARLVDERGFEEALAALDAALDALLAHNGRECVRLAAYAVSAEPSLLGLMGYIERLASPRGVPSVLLDEALRVGREGRLLDARPLLEATRTFELSAAQEAQRAALDAACERLAGAELRARLEREEYARAEEWVRRCEEVGLGAEVLAGWRLSARRRPTLDAHLTAARALRGEGAAQASPPLAAAALELAREYALRAGDAPSAARSEALSAALKGAGLEGAGLEGAGLEVSGAGRASEARDGLISALRELGGEDARWRSFDLWAEARAALSLKGPARARRVCEALTLRAAWTLAPLTPPHSDRLSDQLGGELCALSAALALLSHDPLTRERALSAWRAWLRAACERGPWSLPAVPVLPEQREPLDALYEPLSVGDGLGEFTLPHCGEYARLCATSLTRWGEAVESFSDLLAAAESHAEAEVLRSRYARWCESLRAPLGDAPLSAIDALLGEPWLRRETGGPQTGIQIPTGFGELSLDLVLSLWGRARRYWMRRALRKMGVEAQLAELISALAQATSRE